MPWSETTPMDQKMQFIADYLRGELGMTELCELYGIARKTGYKFVERYLRAGPEALEEGSRKPLNHANAGHPNAGHTGSPNQPSIEATPVVVKETDPIVSLDVV